MMRRPKGSILFLVGASTAAICALALGIICLLRLFGGYVELCNMNEACDLNIAKQALVVPQVRLKSGDEEFNFKALLNKDRTVDLRTFNRLVGQTSLVCLNAEQEGTLEAQANAKRLGAACNAVSCRLREEIMDENWAEAACEPFIKSNSLRMLDKPTPSRLSQFKASYMESESGATNITISPEIAAMLPSSSKVTIDKKTYLSGYRTLRYMGEFGTKITGVPLQPGQAPHLVSRRDCARGGHPDIATDIVPPNAFKLRLAVKANAKMMGDACAIVGCQDREFPMQIASGYIKICNLPGVADLGSTLIAAEAVNAQVIRAFVSDVENPNISVPAEPTGIRILANGRLGLNFVPGPNRGWGVIASKPASILQLLRYIGEDVNDYSQKADGRLLDELHKRVRQIGAFTNEEIDSVLDNTLLDLGETAYIYVDPSSGKLLASKCLPPGYVGSMDPDGNPESFNSVPYPTLGTIINPANGLEHMYSDWTAPFSDTAQESAKWTPSSGFNNLLGVLEFQDRMTADDTSASIQP